ncbi:MAG: hypothetical protein QOI06_1050 [Nocardioidaceae bacterium]|nr:hypothetical protein [Nocardioidaceae bacterium]
MATALPGVPAVLGVHARRRLRSWHTSKMPHIRVSDYGDHISKLRSPQGDLPPHRLTQAVLSLCGDDQLETVLSTRREDDKGSEWRVVALTKTSIVYASVQGGERDWDADSHVEDENPTGWLRNRSDVVSMEISQLLGDTQPAQSEWRWGVGWMVCFSDGSSLVLPLFAGTVGLADDPGVDEIVKGLRKSLSQRSGRSDVIRTRPPSTKASGSTTPEPGGENSLPSNVRVAEDAR